MSKRIDLLSGSIAGPLTKLALPIMGTSLIQMAYNMVDMIWVGRVGSDAVAAVGAAGAPMCWDMDRTIFDGSGITTVSRLEVRFSCGTPAPCAERLRNLLIQISTSLILLSLEKGRPAHPKRPSGLLFPTGTEGLTETGSPPRMDPANPISPAHSGRTTKPADPSSCP